MAGTLARIGAYKVAGLFHAERHLIERRWQAVTPEARSAFVDAKAIVTRSMASKESS